MKSTAETILDLMELPEGQHQLGITKVFMRKGAFEMLESRRAKSIALATVLMQTRGRTYIAQRAYENMRRATLTFQALGRGRAARRVGAAHCGFALLELCLSARSAQRCGVAPCLTDAFG